MAQLDMKQVMSDPEIINNVQMLLGALSIAKGGDANKPVEVNVAKSFQSLLLAAAIMLEAEPLTPKERKLASIDTKQIMKHFLDGLAVIREQTGKSLIETMGIGGNPTYHEPDPTPLRH